ncbi:MAG: DUF354 domain-containing protein [Bacteroidales bacterium]|nr:DUF354 domain-containing protein [Bacteroidales bacterium]
MKILIDINHPAHVHYFRNFIRLMEEKGHSFRIVNRDSAMINQLLDAYGLQHVIRNSRPKKKGTFTALKYLWGMIRYCLKESGKFRPDLYMGFGSAPCAITSFLRRKPCILLEDTEHNTMNHKLYKPFVEKVITPFYFEKELWKKENGKQVRMNAYIEQLYLHSHYFSLDRSVLEELGLEAGKYVVIRFTAFGAHHDMKVNHISPEFKKRIVASLSDRYKIVLSLENKADESEPEFAPYLMHFPPEKIHHIMAGAAFVLTEGGTMASEAFVLGVPYVFLSPLLAGNLNYQSRNYPDQVFLTNSEEEVSAAVETIESTINEKPGLYGTARRKQIEEETVDPTGFVEDFVISYMSK